MSMTYREACKQAIRAAILADKRVFLMGEDVARMAETIVPGSVIGPTAKMTISLVFEWINSMACMARCTF